jgi:uncharacterized surface anchored protein
VQGMVSRDSLAALPSDRFATVDGRIVGGDAQLPVIGAELALQRTDSSMPPVIQRTQAGGVFTFDDIVPGDYELKMTKIEFDTVFITLAAIPLRLGAGQSETMTITMPDPEDRRAFLCHGASAKSVIVHGAVTDSATGHPIARAKVAAIWRRPKLVTAEEREVTTDKDGQYAFCDLEPTGDVVVASSAVARMRKRAPGFPLREGGIYMVNFRLGN